MHGSDAAVTGPSLCDRDGPQNRKRLLSGSLQRAFGTPALEVPLRALAPGGFLRFALFMPFRDGPPCVRLPIRRELLEGRGFTPGPHLPRGTDA